MAIIKYNLIIVKEVRGEEIIREVYEKGFRNLYLTTGHSPETFPPLPWIRGIVGKGPLWDSKN